MFAPDAIVCKYNDILEGLPTDGGPAVAPKAPVPKGTRIQEQLARMKKYGGLYTLKVDSSLRRRGLSGFAEIGVCIEQKYRSADTSIASSVFKNFILRLAYA